VISQHTSCRKVAYIIGGIYDVIEWSRGHSDYLADHSSIQILNRPTFFGCFIGELLEMIEFDASFAIMDALMIDEKRLFDFAQMSMR